ncbi:DUF5063 domain-containing protein [Owenweeksia hongkongensis]|uniref:DUF5063 domain-containing protein n=1 Tax=Owenweeksia hongkongensis TaxID=253245 RepID=UPI003A8CED90
MNKALIDILESTEVQDTLKAAKAYCDLISFIKENEIEQEDLIDKLHQTLTELYQKAILLPKIDLVINEEPEEIKRENESPIIASRLENILNGYTEYAEAHDPTILGKDENYLQGWLTDDLIDIYHDLKEILLKIDFEEDSNLQDALWDLKFGLGTHWGNHLVDALRYLHYVRYGHLARHMI